MTLLATKMPQVFVSLPCHVWCMDVVVGRRHTVNQKLKYLFINLRVARKYGHHRQPNCLPSMRILELFRMTLKLKQVVMWSF